MTALLAAGVDHRLEVGGEQIAAVATAPTGGPTPADEATQLSLGVIVRWIDAEFEHKAPQRLAVFDDVATGALEALDRQRCALVEQLFDQRAEIGGDEFAI